MQKVKIDSIFVALHSFNIYKNIFKISDCVSDWKTENVKGIEETIYKLQFESFDQSKPFTHEIKLPFDLLNFQLNKIQRIYGSGETGKIYLFLKQYKLHDSVYLVPTNELMKNKNYRFSDSLGKLAEF